MQPDQDWMAEQDLIDTIRGVFRTTPQIELGTAWGQALEDPDRYLAPGGYRCQGYEFSAADIGQALALIDRRGVFEAKGTKQYGDCTVVAKADHLYGALLTEFKTTTSTFNVEKYLDSCQWRFMADIFEPMQIRYHVFCLDDHENGVASLKGIESFNVYPYPGLHQDCDAIVRSFAAYVTAKGLDGLLRQRQRDAA